MAAEQRAIVKQHVKDTKAPYPGLIIDIEERKQFPNLVWLVVYRSNIEEFSDRQQDELGIWLIHLRTAAEMKIAQYGYQVALDGVDE